MQRRTFRAATSALAIAATSALLAGCFTIEASFTINDDATADVDYLVLIDTEQFEELGALLGQDTADLDDLSGDALLGELLGDDDPCADLVDDFSDFDVSVREIDNDGQVGVGCTVAGIPLDELTSVGDDTSEFSIQQDSSGTRFEAVLEGVDELAGDPDETNELTSLLGVDATDLITIRFVVSAPGSLGTNNASSTNGSTATWEVTPDAEFVANGNATMTAEWTPGGGGGSSSWGIIALVAALAALGVFAFVLFRRSKAGPTSPTSPTTAAEQPASTPAAASAPSAPVAPPPPPPMTPPAPPMAPPPAST
jgi:hypothetical protein